MERALQKLISVMDRLTSDDVVITIMIVGVVLMMLTFAICGTDWMFKDEEEDLKDEDI